MIAKDVLRAYLNKQLKMLHQENQSVQDMMDCAVNEGGIIQIEIMYQELLGETPPSKESLLNLKFSHPPSKNN